MFETDGDRTTYLRLLKQNLRDTAVRLLAWCLMTNHVHLVALPEREDSLAILLRRVHGRYAQYFNARQGRVGHLWQNRYFACPLGGSHLPRALAYVERNPVRAGTVAQAGEYRWASARAHLTGEDQAGLLDMEWWEASGLGEGWADILHQADGEAGHELQRCTYAGRPYGGQDFVEELGRRFGRGWKRGRPKKAEHAGNIGIVEVSRQMPLFCIEK